MPTGTLMKKIACQPMCSTSRPPSVGPKTGARMIGTPIDAHHARHVARAGGLDERDLADRDQQAAREALEHARGDERLEVPGEPAERGARGEEDEAEDVEAAGAEAGGGPAGDGDDGREGRACSR